MRKIIWFVLLIAILFAPRTALAKEVASSAALNAKDAKEEKDVRVDQLTDFLASYNSPLTDFAADLIANADRYGIDWKLVPAIAGVESTFGKHIPYQSYNAYGWANGAYAWNSWPESIEHVSRVLAEKYYARGLDTPTKISPVYAPPSSTWAGKVSFFMKKLVNFTSENPVEKLTLTI